MARMDDLEKLARDLCWAGFSTPRGTGTKAAYWKGVSPEAKTRYLDDARIIRWAVRKLGIKRLAAVSDTPEVMGRSTK